MHSPVTIYTSLMRVHSELSWYLSNSLIVAHHPSNCPTITMTAPKKPTKIQFNFFETACASSVNAIGQWKCVFFLPPSFIPLLTLSPKPLETQTTYPTPKTPSTTTSGSPRSLRRARSHPSSSPISTAATKSTTRVKMRSISLDRRSRDWIP